MALPLHLSIFFLSLLVLSPFPLAASRTVKPTVSPFTKTLQSLEGIHQGQSAKGLGELKTYLSKLGYLNNNHNLNDISDWFDENLETAIKDYQKFHGLAITGSLDSTTIQTLILPRCGVADIHKHSHNKNGLIMVSNFAYYDGSPKWAIDKRDLTYSYSSTASTLSTEDMRQAIASAFLTWARITDFTFTEVSRSIHADILIGFLSHDHGDGNPFDGRGRVLGHAFAPQDGRVHFDGDELWSNNPGSTQVDLESVALHEIGHILGLAHSSNADAVMFPAYGGKRRSLGQDDIDGIRKLYMY
ncbi:hypothetical protein L6164_005879 [Bauhinia variegata]|uniref:Uncharacterized protein n=1 Tax=Bauhinia variegata TaxID=167791 RepID=A0ACB9PSM5_BAUVA|nr:hypothetical protein L6164_005879 [Bauhinia variegata]